MKEQAINFAVQQAWAEKYQRLLVQKLIDAGFTDLTELHGDVLLVVSSENWDKYIKCVEEVMKEMQQ